ncbi:hypothetical protein THMIRHAS_08710 [Thiosulfatimonas sediminis]|uniref:YbgF trimerisation domain-containing protein n=1 Tax=Thiosulfatimonas sediminis TaxID=2675054 RepID=A0A6F8PU13_9GAMM|nr:hypothetical protein [Thiosulfatimonas sediminis]BBP45498.1 hypothetical protein THMIRHAS_08710 [Thiosulfatimonas sediminis]
MKKRTIQSAVLVVLLMVEGTALAASISTRVRILEGKVASQERTVKQVSETNAAQKEQFEQGMNKVHQLERKVQLLDKKFSEQFDEKAKTNAVKSGGDKRYAYP